MDWREAILVPVSSQGDWVAKQFLGDPKLASAYLKLGYKLLGDLKYRMENGQVRFGFFKTELPDGTVIQVMINEGHQRLIIDTNPYSNPQNQLVVPPHGFCFFPKSIENPNGWIYEKKEIIPNPKKGYEAYIGNKGGNCFGTATYSGVTDPLKITGAFGASTVSGNQFFYDGMDVYSWIHSAKGDLPLLMMAGNWDWVVDYFVPFIVNFEYVYWKIDKKNFERIPDTVFKNGAVIYSSSKGRVVLGVCTFNKRIIVVFTEDLRTLQVGSLRDPYTIDVFYTHAIYSYYPYAYCLTGRAFFNEEGSRFAIVSNHKEFSLITEYLLHAVAKEDMVDNIHTKVELLPIATYPYDVYVTSTDDTVVNSSGKLTGPHNVQGWIVQDKASGYWGTSDGNRPVENKNAGSASLLATKTSNTPSLDVPIAVVYTDNTHYVDIVVSYAQEESNVDTATVSASYQERLQNQGDVYTETNLYRMGYESHSDSTEGNTYHNKATVELKKGGISFYTLERHLMESSSSMSGLWHIFVSYKSIADTESYATRDMASSGSSASSKETSVLLFFDFKTMRSVCYKKTEDITNTSTGNWHLMNNPAGRTDGPITGGSSLSSRTERHNRLILTIKEEVTLFDLPSVDEASTTGDSESVRYLWPSTPIPAQSSSEGSPTFFLAKPRYITPYLNVNYGTATIVSDQRKPVSGHDFYMYDTLFYPQGIYGANPMYFHGDAMGGVIDKLPFETGNVSSFIVGLF